MGLNKENAGTLRFFLSAPFRLNLSCGLCFVFAYSLSLPFVHAIDFITLEIQLPLPGEKGANADRIMPAYVTAPDSLGGMPLSIWLDTSQQTTAGEKVWSSKPLNPEERTFIKAFQALMRLDLVSAMELHREGLSLPKQHKLYQTYAANACVLLLYVGERSEAEHRLRKIAQKSTPGSEGAWRTLYSLFLATDRELAADSLVNVVLKRDPHHVFAVAAKEWMLRQATDAAAYENFLREQSAYGDTLAFMQQAYGQFLLAQGRWREAARQFDRVVQGHPRNGDAWMGLGRAHAGSGWYVFAEEAFRTGLSLGTRDMLAYERYAQVLIACCMDPANPHMESVRDRAEHLLEKGLALRQGSRRAAQLLMKMYGLGGRVEAAQNLRRNFWFHFVGSDLKIPILGVAHFYSNEPARYLKPKLNWRTFPIFLSLRGD